MGIYGNKEGIINLQNEGRDVGLGMDLLPAQPTYLTLTLGEKRKNLKSKVFSSWVCQKIKKFENLTLILGRHGYSHKKDSHKI